MQKLVNVLAVASFAVSGAVVVSGVYVYVNRDSIIDGVKSQVMEAVTGSLGGALGGGLGGLGGGDAELPIGGGALVPEMGSGIPSGGLSAGSASAFPF